MKPTMCIGLDQQADQLSLAAVNERAEQLSFAEQMSAAGIGTYVTLSLEGYIHIQLNVAKSTSA